MPKSFVQQIEDDENKIKRIREHQRMVRAKQAKQERNARTKRRYFSASRCVSVKEALLINYAFRKS